MPARRRRHAAATIALIAGLSLLPAVAFVGTASAATGEASATAPAAAAGKVQPTLTVDLMQPAVAPDDADLRVRMDPVPAQNAAGIPVTVVTDMGEFGVGYWEAPNSFWVSTATLPAGHHWAQASSPETATLAAATSPRFEFDVAPEPVRTATKTTLTMPKAPVGGAAYPYVIAVSPSAGSTGRVELSTYDWYGNLYYLGVGALKNGTATITATVPQGEHVIIARFAGDDRYAVSAASARQLYPARSVTISDPPAVPVPSQTPSTPTSATASPSAVPVTASGPGSTPGELAFTGADLWQGVGWSAGLVAAGVLLTVVSRRRGARRV